MPQIKTTHSFTAKSMRLHGWDYGNNGAYFLTFNTKNRIHHFGEIQMNENGKMYMQLNSNGLIAEKIWESIPQQFPYAELGNFVVMPDHFHGVIFIDNIRFQIDEKEVKKDNLKNNIGGCTGNKNPMLHENISHIIRWYKGRCTYEIKKMQKNFAWQSRFYDHIIRNEQSFERIQHYIAKNPENWKVKKKI